MGLERRCSEGAGAKGATGLPSHGEPPEGRTPASPWPSSSLGSRCLGWRTENGHRRTLQEASLQRPLSKGTSGVSVHRGRRGRMARSSGHQFPRLDFEKTSGYF